MHIALVEMSAEEAAAYATKVFIDVSVWIEYSSYFSGHDSEFSNLAHY